MAADAPGSALAAFAGKRVLVTGGTGSLGSHLVGRLLALGTDGPAALTVLSRDEAKQHELRLRLAQRAAATDDVIYGDASSPVRFQIGDVRDLASLERAVDGIDVVVHAAALKQVPTCEYAPEEAVRTNVGGAANLVRAVHRAGTVEAVVGVSTDKACRPVNVMGMTKALMERTLVEANLGPAATRFLSVRYGNVIASRGSVVPLFVEQLRAGDPVTLTDAAMTRFLLTLDDACEVVGAALAGGRPGEVWVPLVGAARMAELIEVLAGGRAVDVVVTGIRPGEKLHEELVSPEEAGRAVRRSGHIVVRPVLPELGGIGDDARHDGAYTSEAVDLDAPGLTALLRAAGVEVPVAVAGGGR